MLIVGKVEQPWKHDVPKLVTLVGILTEFKRVQFWKQLLGNPGIEDGMLIVGNAEHDLKHETPKLVTFVGIVTEVKTLQFKKHELAKLITTDPISTLTKVVCLLL